MRSLFFWSELLSLLFMTWVLTLSFPHENVKKNNLRFIFFHERNSVNSFFHNFSCVKMRWKIPRDFSISETELFIFNFSFLISKRVKFFQLKTKSKNIISYRIRVFSYVNLNKNFFLFFFRRKKIFFSKCETELNFQQW